MTQSGGELAGRVALITGAAQGMGRAVAERLAAEGAVPVLADLRAEGLQALETSLRAGGVEAKTRALDIADEHQVGTWISEVVRDLGFLTR